MSYSTGKLKHRITILNRSTSTVGVYGKDSSGVTWTETDTVWASVDYSRGLRSMREGALDAYEVIQVRIRYTDNINMRSRIVYDGNTYQILPGSYHAEYQENTIQFNAQLMVDAS